jgi:hypothetical protein
MIGNLYTLAVGAQAQTAAKTLIEIAAASSSVAILERAYISQNSFDTSENLGCKIQRITTTGTGTTSTSDMVPTQVATAAFAGVAKTNMTIEPTYTANKVFLQQGFNVLGGFLWTPANDDEVFALAPSGLLGIMLDVAPSASMNFSYGCTVRQIG